MASSVSGFLKTYVLIVVIFLVIAVVLTLLLHWPFLEVAAQVYLWIGVGYVFASVLAWTGFANLYRYSPTLFLGSPSYRQQIIRGQLWKEGRDSGSLLVGSAFGLALMGLGAALWDPLFIVLDSAVIALVVLLFRYRRSRATARA